MPRIEKAFDTGEDPTIAATWRNIETDLGLLGRLGSDISYGSDRQIGTARRMCERLADLLDAITLNKPVAETYRAAASNLPPELRLSDI
jgi:hypothetical protein